MTNYTTVWFGLAAANVENVYDTASEPTFMEDLSLDIIFAHASRPRSTVVGSEA
jgi:hypothetical protein